MKYSSMCEGMYVVRTRDLSGAKSLTGVICHVEGVDNAGNLLIRKTEDCVPVDSVLRVPKHADDNCWYDISDMVMEANSVIIPPPSTCRFQSPVEANYRNFLGFGNLAPLELSEATEHICLIGEPHPELGAIFSKVGYYVVGCDCNGYILAYRGFCEYSEGYTEQPTTLQVLNFSGTERAFYPAEKIVSACHEAYTQDCDLAATYRSNIEAATFSSGTEVAGGTEIPVEAIQRMALGGA